MLRGGPRGAAGEGPQGRLKAGGGGRRAAAAGGRDGTGRTGRALRSAGPCGGRRRGGERGGARHGRGGAERRGAAGGSADGGAQRRRDPPSQRSPQPSGGTDGSASRGRLPPRRDRAQLPPPTAELPLQRAGAAPRVGLRVPRLHVSAGGAGPPSLAGRGAARGADAFTEASPTGRGPSPAVGEAGRAGGREGPCGARLSPWGSSERAARRSPSRSGPVPFRVPGAGGAPKMRGGDSGGVGVGPPVRGRGGSAARVPASHPPNCARGVGTAAVGNAVGLRCPALRVKDGSWHRTTELCPLLRCDRRPRRYGIALRTGMLRAHGRSPPRVGAAPAELSRACTEGRFARGRRLCRGPETLRAAAGGRRGDVGGRCLSCPAAP